jgi:DNA polymerase III epsilon subunit-like protein
MINGNYIVVFDFEVSGIDPFVDEPVQIASVTIDPYKLEIVKDSEFESLMKPIKIFTGTPDEVDDNWIKHQGAWDVNKKTKEELRNAPLPDHVWKAFVNHVKKYNTRGWGGKPIPSGHNIQGYDLHIVDRLCREYKVAVDKNGKQQLFNTRTILDTLNVLFLWFENQPEPTDYKMDTFRKYFGMSSENSHDAGQDVRDSAEILIRFLKLHRHFAPKVRFKGSFSTGELT